MNNFKGEYKGFIYYYENYQDGSEYDEVTRIELHSKDKLLIEVFLIENKDLQEFIKEAKNKGYQVENDKELFLAFPTLETAIDKL